MSTAKRREQLTLGLADAEPDDFSGRTVLVGVSGGVNSAGLLVHLLTAHPEDRRPARLLLFYAHLREHSPDTGRFALDCMRWARARHPDVACGVHRASALDRFRAERFLPHPAVSPCTSWLKLEPMAAWAESVGGFDVDLVGYVRHERRRVERQRAKGGRARYPVAHLSDADCLALVDEHVGWHPAIYDLRREDGAPAFANNNCLPCKNMHARQLRLVQVHYPDYWDRAVEAAAEIGTYWGRSEEYAGDPCAACAFD